MSAPKPELTAELRAVALSATLRLKEFSAKCVAEGRPAKQSEMCEEVMNPLVREVVEIVAKIDADEAYDMGLQTDDPSAIRRAILSHWGLLERKP